MTRMEYFVPTSILIDDFHWLDWLAGTYKVFLNLYPTDSAYVENMFINL